MEMEKSADNNHFLPENRVGFAFVVGAVGAVGAVGVVAVAVPAAAAAAVAAGLEVQRVAESQDVVVGHMLRIRGFLVVPRRAQLTPE